MADEFPRSPKLLKGALAVYASHTPGTQPSLVIFQYNPAAIRRTLADRTPPPPTGNVGAAKEDVLRVLGPPVETISMTVELAAADQLEHPDENQTVAEHGLHPALATLELIMYPPERTVQRIEQQAQQGQVEVSPADLPLVLLVWGKSRVVPVDVTGFTVAEEAFDPRLNPIRARVDLTLKVLTYIELDGKSLGHDAFLAYQKQKENLAAQHRPGTDEAGIRELLPAARTT
jgi:hypothetical protein